MATLGLGQLTAVDVTPEEYISIAAEVGVDSVSLFVCQPGLQAKFPLTTTENLAAIKQRLNSSGIGVANIDCFMLTPNVDVAEFLPLIDLGAQLEAQGATVLLYDNDQSRVADHLNLLCEMARQAGLRIGVEFMPFTPKWKNLPDTVELIRQLAIPNLGVAIDLLHLIRTGGSPKDVATIDPSLISFVQLCDGISTEPADNYFAEAGIERMAPGAGNFPVQEFLQAVPADTLLELEVPQLSDLSPLERIRIIVESTRRQIRLAEI